MSRPVSIVPGRSGVDVGRDGATGSRTYRAKKVGHPRWGYAWKLLTGGYSQMPPVRYSMSVITTNVRTMNTTLAAAMTGEYE